ncbi:hypothetical protein T459_27501 [Capsicum annuum]|uniref:Uncharacterized protein n=1 Tax=Capsicum annuum TaxID=4072 RepID=A0A2G2YE38_CAPAN|nr:hypothetical protein T459_27501 [Capsicum annuum]
MVTVAQLNEDIIRVQKFIGMTNELTQTEGVIDLVTQIKALKEDLAFLRAQYDERSIELLSSCDALMSVVQDQGKVMEDLQMEMMVLQCAVAASRKTHESSSKVKIPEPKPFGSARSTKELENFLWDIDQYIIAARVTEIDKLNITTMYLTGDTKLWWCTRNTDDESDGCPKIDTWDDMKKERGINSLLAMPHGFLETS